MANEHTHNHGHVMTHEHGDHGQHDHRFSHSHSHVHDVDGTNEHDGHEHIELNGPVFAHREHHTNAEAPSVMVAPGELPPADEQMTEPGEVSNEPMIAPGDEPPKSRSLWWGE